MQEVRHGLHVLFAAEGVTDELFVRSARYLPRVPEVSEALRMWREGEAAEMCEAVAIRH